MSIYLNRKHIFFVKIHFESIYISFFMQIFYENLFYQNFPFTFFPFLRTSPKYKLLQHPEADKLGLDTSIHILLTRLSREIYPANLSHL